MKRLTLAALVALLLVAGFTPASKAFQEIFGWACGGDVCIGSTSGTRDVYILTGGNARAKFDRAGTVTHLSTVQNTVGAGTGTAYDCGTLSTDTTTVATAADTNPVDAFTYTLPANSLNTNGRGVEIQAWGSFGATANTKNLFLIFAGSNIFNRSSTGNNLGWTMTARVIRLTASTYRFSGEAHLAGTSFTMTPSDGSATMSSANTLVVRIVNGSAAAADITYLGSMVRCF